MKKTLGFLVVLTALIAVLALVAQSAVRPTNPRLQQAVDLKPHAAKVSATDDPQDPSSRFAPVGIAVANPAADSRGKRISQTYNDVPGNVTSGNLVAVPLPGADQAAVHFGYRAKASPGPTGLANPAGTNRMGYSCYDPLGAGTFPIPDGKVIVADASPTSVEGGSTARVLAYPDGRAIVTGYSYPDADGQPDNFYIHTVMDFAPLSGNFGDQSTGSIMSNTKNIEGSWTPGTQSLFPYSFLDINGSGANDTIIYILTDGGHAGRWYDQFKVFRKIGTSLPGGVDATWSLVYTDSTYGFTGIGLACDPTSTRIAVYTTVPVVTDTTGGHGEDIWWSDSPTGNPGTWTRHNLTNLTPSSLDIPWLEVVGMFDSQGKLHLVFNATYNGDGITYNSVICRGLHWSEHDVTKFYVLYDARWPLGDVCGRNGYNTLNIGQFAIGECENRLYAVWSAANDAFQGVLDDCVKSQTAFSHKGNGEIYVSVSKDLTGKSWDRPRNVSASYTPDCDTGTCASDILPAMTQFGISDADFAGTESWTNSSATWDLSGGTYTGSKYLQVFYLQDKYPSRAGATGTGGITPAWTLNDWRWVRMSCAPPVVAAGLTLSRDAIEWPEFTHPSTAESFKIILNASGNADLVFSSITDIEDSAKGPGAGPSNWMTISGAPASILEGGVDSLTVNLNAGGVITAGPTTLFGKVRFNFTPPSQTKDLLIQFTVADTIVNTKWDTVSTACLDLAVGTDGNMGRSGGDGAVADDTGRINMDYFGTIGTDCDTGVNSRGSSRIYLYDGSPIIVRKPTPTTYRGSWSAWSEGFATLYGFKPVLGFAPHGSFSSASYDGFNSGTFLTVDSLIKVERTWYAPTNADSCNFVVERTRIFPATIASSIPNLQIGEVIDWDIPSDTTGNVGGTDPTHKMVYMRGFNRTDTVTDCADNSKRYGGMALLNWHMKNKACFDSLYGASTFQNQIYVYPGVEPDSMSRLMHIAGYVTEPSITDLSAMLTFKDGPSGYTLPANDTLTIYTALATTKPNSTTTLTGLDSLKRHMDKAKEFMKKNLGVCASCCVGVTGNVNMTGIVDLSDLSALVSYLTGGGYVLPCSPEANVNNTGIVDLSDLSALVSYLTGGGYVLPNCS